MSTASHSHVPAIFVGLVQNGGQALSRSLFVSMIPRNRLTEFVGFFAVLETLRAFLDQLFLLEWH